MNILRRQFQSQILLKIKQIVDEDKNGDKFIVVRTAKNVEFIREYGLREEDIKNIVRELLLEDCFMGPEEDRDSKYEGWILKFCPTFENIKLYIKIRLENKYKAVCISVHEFGKYDEVK